MCLVFTSFLLGEKKLKAVSFINVFTTSSCYVLLLRVSQEQHLVLICISVQTDIQRQNEKRCEQEIEEIKREVKSGNITPDTSLIRFSDAALDEQRHSLLIADEKVSLAVQVYDMVQIFWTFC